MDEDKLGGVYGEIENVRIDPMAETDFDFDTDANDSTVRNDQMSRQKSTTSVKPEGAGSLEEYFEESDYSQNIASAVANILAESENCENGICGGDSCQEMGASGGADADEPKRGSTAKLKKKKKSKSKQRIRVKKSTAVGDLKSKKSTNVSPVESETRAFGLTPSAELNMLIAQEFGDVSAAIGSQATEAAGAMSEKTAHTGLVLRPPAAPVSKNPNMLEVNVYLARVQEYINKLGYHRQGEPKIRIHTHMSLKHQTDTAKQLIKAAEPIKCLHALVLGIHLTNCTPLIERFTINFRSNFVGKEYKHVVLGIYMYGFFGAIGISRDVGLQDKPVAFQRLSELLAEFKRSYTESGHVLTEVKIGGIVPHDPYSLQHINWKLGTLKCKGESTDLDLTDADKLAKSLRSQMGAACLKQTRIEITGPMILQGNHQTLAASISFSDLTVKTIASPPPRIPKTNTSAKKTSSKARASTNNLAPKKKTKNQSKTPG